MVTLHGLAGNANWTECNNVLFTELMPQEGKLPADMRTQVTENARAVERPSPQPPAPTSESPRIVAARRCPDGSTRAPAYTEHEVNSEAFDQPVSQVRAKIIICSTPRTGSYLLCRAMIHAGIGIPHEYFNRMNAGMIGTRYRLGPVTSDDLETDGVKRRAYIAALLEHRTVNGVFAAKIQRGQFRQYFNNYKIDLFRGAHFIYLYREDLVAQAVSLHMSLLTGRWGVDDVVTTPPAINPNFFDNRLITEIMDELATQDNNFIIGVN